MEQLKFDFFEPVTLRISFEDLFGKKASDMPGWMRKKRWQEWKALPGQDEEVIRGWRPQLLCLECVDFEDGDWCYNHDLPCSVNPILSFSTGMPGFACMGVAFEKKGGR